MCSSCIIQTDRVNICIYTHSSHVDFSVAHVPLAYVELYLDLIKEIIFEPCFVLSS